MSREQWEQMKENALAAVRGILSTIDNPESAFKQFHADGPNASVTFESSGKVTKISWTVDDGFRPGFRKGDRVRAKSNSPVFPCCLGSVVMGSTEGSCHVLFDCCRDVLFMDDPELEIAE